MNLQPNEEKRTDLEQEVPGVLNMVRWERSYDETMGTH